MQTRHNSPRILVTGILLLLCLPAAFAAEKSFDRTLTVNGPVTLKVSTGSGYIHVSPGSDNQVHIVGHAKSNNSWWGGSSDDAVAKVADNPPINQAGNIIRVGEDHGSDFLRHVSIDYEITTPSNTMLSAESGSGDLQLSNITGTVQGHTGSGSIHADKIGAGSKLDTGSGTIEASNLLGSISLETGSGDISAQLAVAGDAVANTGSGSIKLTNVRGVVKAETGSGSLEISGSPTSPWKLETGSGSISMQLGSSAHFTLDAETGSGTVKSDLPLTIRGSMDKHHVVGTVNGGGPTIKAETGSGDIHIQ